MKFIGYIAAAVGFFLMLGTIGEIDFYQECKLAADCVAGNPMSGIRFFLQMFGGFILSTLGVFWVWVWSE